MNYRQDTVKNKAVLMFDLHGKSHVVESNEVEAKKVEIRVVKEQSSNLVFCGDKICYKISIYNDSCVDLCNIQFRDRLDGDLKYERNSFKVNGDCKQADLNGRTLCYHINQLNARECMVITFDTEVQ